MKVIDKIHTDNSLQQLDLLNPVETYFAELNKYQNGYVPIHWHDEIQLNYVISGSVKVKVEDKEFILNKDQGIFINSGCIHDLMPHEDSSPIVKCVMFSLQAISMEGSEIDKELLSPFINAEDKISAVVLDKSVDWQNNIIIDLNRIFAHDNSKDFGYQLAINASLNNIMYYIINAHEKKTSRIQMKSSIRIKKVLLYIQQNYKKKIVLQDLATLMGVTKAECCRCFNQYLHCSPIKYINIYRVTQSMVLLQNTDDPISEIAEEVGFSGTSYYIEQFKQQVGTSPYQYRKKITNKAIKRL